jgi:uncharacterized protein with HEPN domain
MTINRLSDYLAHIEEAARDAHTFTADMSRESFMMDKRTQQAVIMSMIIMGEAATKLMDEYPEFVAGHTSIPWRSMRGMRNRMAHGYFEINLDIVWQTVQISLPQLIEQIRPLITGNTPKTE